MRIVQIAASATCAFLMAACTTAAPATPTSPPAPTTAPTTAPKPAVSPAAASPAPSPVSSPAAAAKPAASPAGSPAASPASSPAAQPSQVVPAGSPVAIPQPAMSGTATPGFALTSSAFKDGDTFPTQFTCAPTGQPNGATSPPLAWSGAPATAKTFAIIEQDMDVPPPNGPVVHWLIFNIPGTATSLDSGIPQVETLPNGAVQGVNSLRTLGYIGSCPPPGAAPHHYVFQLFAMDGPITFKSPAILVDVAPAMQGHIVGQTKLGATFGR